jgi:ubiquinone/menaquinone biosynthesis C-methylase UbiE
VDEWPDVEHTYDVVAEDYAAAFADELDHKPADRALLESYAGAVSGSVFDVGCGPAGHITRFLADRGVSVTGVDLSSQVIKVARTRHPDLVFEVADLRELPAADASLGGLVAFYSVVHLRRPDLPAAFTEFARVLAPGGLLLIGMHGGTGEIGADDWFDRGVTTKVTLVEPEELAGLVRAAGFTVAEQHRREPYESEYPTPRLYVLARR